ncbi:site-specific integrase [Vibrio sinaloensis]|nr:site-specific integrase [Vibrio sinaloensis]
MRTLLIKCVRVTVISQKPRLAPKKLITVSPKQACKPRPRFGQEALSEFIESKQLENVTQLTIKQLQQRCTDFLKYLSAQGANQPTNSLAMAYRDELIQRQLSHKTLNDYLAANRQFFNWCVAKELVKNESFCCG